MIKRVQDEKRACICDELLTKLIQDERQYDDTLDENFVVKDYFKNMIKYDNNILLCYEDDEIIKGYIFLKIFSDSSCKTCLIDGLYVLEEYRNNHIATKLIDEALTIIKKSDVKYVDINVLANNEIAYKMYKSLGFDEFKIGLRKEL